MFFFKDFIRLTLLKKRILKKKKYLRMQQNLVSKEFSCNKKEAEFEIDVNSMNPK